MFIADISNSAILQNDIRFAIVETFAREEIGIAYMDRLTTLKKEGGDDAEPAGAASVPAILGTDAGNGPLKQPRRRRASKPRSRLERLDTVQKAKRHVQLPFSFNSL